MEPTNLGTGAVLYRPGEKKLIWIAAGIEYASFILPEGARVLDIGAGQDPHPAADVVADKYLKDNTHRMGQYDVPDEMSVVSVDMQSGKPIGRITRKIEWIEADITDLPFDDKSFDFVISRHILEHVPDLRKALKEISRVGKAGYIEVPKYTSEVLWPQGEIHRWTFDDIGGTLVAQSIIGYKSPFGKIMHELFAQRADIREAWAKEYFHFHACKFWKGEPECVIIDELEDKRESQSG